MAPVRETWRTHLKRNVAALTHRRNGLGDYLILNYPIPNSEACLKLLHTDSERLIEVVKRMDHWRTPKRSNNDGVVLSSNQIILVISELIGRSLWLQIDLGAKPTAVLLRRGFS